MPFELTIVTPEGQAYQGSVDRVVLPGSEGEFGVLADHERFLSPLKIGALEIETAEGPLYAVITDGFAEVNGDEVTVLVDSCQLEHEIDFARADVELSEAEQALEQIAGLERSPDTDYLAAFDRIRGKIDAAAVRAYKKTRKNLIRLTSADF